MIKDSEQGKSAADEVYEMLRIGRGVGAIDLALLVTAVLLFVTDQTVLFFHMIFVLLTLGAFFWRVNGFALRASVWVTVASIAVLLAVHSGQTQFEELIELPLLSAILLGVFLIARHRQELHARLMEKQEVFLETVLENMEDGVIACDADGKLAYSNRAVHDLGGAPSPAMPLEAWPKHLGLYEEDGEAPLSGEDWPLARALRGEPVKDQEVWSRQGENPERLLLVNGKRMVNSAGRGLGAVIVLRDMTELRWAEDARREAREVERRRIARDLHDVVLQDLVYALQSVRVAELRAKDEGTIVKLSKEIGALRKSVEGVRSAIFELRLGDVRERSFAQLLDSLVVLSRRMSPEREIQLLVEDGFPEISGVTGVELVRIIQEALVNVRRHSAAGRVQISLGVNGQEIRAEVTDDGRGFEPETISGVGTSSMRERTMLLGGDLEIRSKPGEGTRVTLRIPVSAAGENSAVEDTLWAGGESV